MGPDSAATTAVDRAHWDDLAAAHAEGAYDLRQAGRGALELAVGGDVLYSLAAERPAA